MMNSLLTILIMTAQFGRAGGSAGAEPLNFLFIDANARPVAMGGAYTALALDSNALLYNPAGLARVDRHEATFMHNQYLAGITQEYAALALRQGLGLNVNYLDSGAVARTTISNPDGTALDYTGLRDLAVGAGYGLGLGDSFSLGVGVKFIQESIAGINAKAFAADVGALYIVPPLPGLRLGLAVQNMGPAAKFQTSREELPLNFRWGAAYLFDVFGYRNALSMDIGKERNESVLVGFGAETVISGVMAVRLGFNNRNTVGTGISGGVGWLYKSLSLDFAVTSYGSLGLTHRVSATMRWGSGSAPAEIPVMAKAAPREPARPVMTQETQPGAAGKEAEPHFAKAQQAIREREFASAKKELQEAAKTLGKNDQRRVRYFERMGYVAWLENDVYNAKAWFLRGLSQAEALKVKDPVVADIHAKLGLCYEAESRDQEAISAYLEGLRSNPTEATKRFLGERLDKLGVNRR